MKMRWVVMMLVAALSPACDASDTFAESRDERDVLSVIKSDLEEKIGRQESGYEVRVSLVDLNDDSINEAIVYLSGEGACGSGGCDTYILSRRDGGFRVVTLVTITWLPIRVLESKSNGWNDLGVWVQGGGIQPSYEARLQYDGNTYPSNPTVVERVSNAAKGRILIHRSNPAKPLYGSGNSRPN